MIFSFVGESNSELTTAGLVSAFFPNVPLYALTATATRHDRKMIITLCMKDVKNIVGNIDRPNIFIEKQFKGADDDALEQIMLPIVEGLTKLKANYPLTIIYLPLCWCGYAYNFLSLTWVNISTSHMEPILNLVTDFLPNTTPHKPRI